MSKQSTAQRAAAGYGETVAVPPKDWRTDPKANKPLMRKPRTSGTGHKSGGTLSKGGLPRAARQLARSASRSTTRGGASARSDRAWMAAASRRNRNRMMAR
ncbi:MAG: hypothetical protein KGL39_28410 [Patescibacteria group bacterium]|nr:hypothetical protein [Patescibacteria group bacterium]